MHEGNSVSNKIKNFIRDSKGLIFTVVILAAVILLFVYAVNGASETADSTAAAELERAITRAAVQCYAIEGFYPHDVAYLKDHYGVIIDENKFAVDYKCEMPNYLPIIKVLYFK